MLKKLLKLRAKLVKVLMTFRADYKKVPPPSGNYSASRERHIRLIDKYLGVCTHPSFHGEINQGDRIKIMSTGLTAKGANRSFYTKRQIVKS